MKVFLAILLVLISAVCQAQTTDFMTSDFNDAESWNQERHNFVSDYDGFIADTSTVLGTDAISRSVSGLWPENGDITLRFSARCGFDNSSVNNFQVYLIANGPDPEDPDFRGFAIATGQKPNYKSLSLIYNEGGNIEVLANTGIAISKKNPEISVSRSAFGVWSVNGQLVYQEAELRFYLASHIVAEFSFTKTGAKKFGIKFIELSQNHKKSDIVSRIDSAKIFSPNIIRVFCNARLNASAANDASNYSANGIQPQNADHHFYYTDLSFADGALPSGAPIRLDVRNQEDSAGRPVSNFSQALRQAGWQQIVFNELMLDLSPAPFALPDSKYVELYNASDDDFRLDGYTFQVGDYVYDLPDVVIPKDGYMILCSSDEAFRQYGQCAAVFQESRLTVSDKTIILRNKLGLAVDSLAYSSRLYNDPSRDGGGFSMERRDPFNNCSGSLNWRASADISGGTPGRRNSQFGIYVDETVPELVGCKAITPSSFVMDFSEPVNSVLAVMGGARASVSDIQESSVTLDFGVPMRDGPNAIAVGCVDVCGTAGRGDTVSISYTPFGISDVFAISQYQLLLNFSSDLADAGTGNFRLSDGQIPFLCEYTNDGRSSLLLSFSDDFAAGKKYSLRVDGLSSQLQETISGRDFGFRYHALQPGDIVINELMYYPNSGAKRYVEIVNRSGGDVFPFGIQLRAYSADGAAAKSALCASHKILADGGYAVLAADTLAVRDYYQAAQGSLFHCPEMPALNTSKGYVAIVSASGVTLDSVYYQKSMHSSILQSVRGVALERVSPDAPPLDAESWRSAQAESGYATPGFENSVYIGSDYAADDVARSLPAMPEVSMEHQLLSPGDGDRQLQITLNIGRQDVCYSASVYDDNGRPARNIATQEMAYPGCVVEWDGRGDDGRICRPGIYVVVIKAWNPSGWNSSWKMACVVGTGR